MRKLTAQKTSMLDAYVVKSESEWEQLKRESGFYDTDKLYPLGMKRVDWIEPKEFPAVVISSYGGAGWHEMNILFVNDILGD